MIRDPETLNLLLDSIRQFVRESLVPHEQEVAETDRIPEAIIARMREMGLFGLSIPEAYGGLGVTMEEEVSIAFEQGGPRRRSVRCWAPTTASAPRASSSTAPKNRSGATCRAWRRANCSVRSASPNRTPVPTPPR